VLWYRLKDEAGNCIGEETKGRSKVGLAARSGGVELYLGGLRQGRDGLAARELAGGIM